MIYLPILLFFFSQFPHFDDMQDSMTLNTKMYLLDGSFISGIISYVDHDNVIKHPLWGSNLLLEDDEAVVKGHRDYIRGTFLKNLIL